jgi:ribosomal protein S18 acetylase RimI-like enzyme
MSNPSGNGRHGGPHHIVGPDHVSPSALQIGVASPDELRAMVSLWKSEFGYYQSGAMCERLLENAVDRQFMDSWAWTISNDYELAAMLVCGFFQIESFNDRFATDTSGWPRAVHNVELSMLATADYWQGRGFANQLVTKFLEYLSGQPVKRVYGVAWERDSQIGSRAVFESEAFGFRQLGREEEYYETPDTVRVCPDCGRGCECAACFYTTTVPETDG